MSVAIVLAYSSDQRIELMAMGFREIQIMVKEIYPKQRRDGEAHGDAAKREGEAELFAMKDPPYQFLVSSYWGRGPG